MTKLSDIIKTFTTGVQKSRVSLAGAFLTSIIFPVLMTAMLLDLFGYINNAYYGFIIYMVLGPAFIFGLILVFLGLFFFKGSREVQIFTMEYLKDQFSDPERFARVKKLIALGVALTFVNIIVVGLLAYSGYHYMESVPFCGQFCHSVMAPEYTTYKRSPHSSVRCVECHIGKGAHWFAKSKISGSRQLFAVALNTYPRPIETPVHGLRPARETCEECHRPELFHGDKLVIRDKTLADEKNSAAQTILLMKIGSAGDRTVSSHGIHWHVSQYGRLTYKTADSKRTIITEVSLTKPDGSKIVYLAPARKDAPAGEHGEERMMDCIDCHNRPTHIYLSAEEAIDLKFNEGKIPRDLPFIKREALNVVNKPYASSEEAQRAIANGLKQWYEQNYPELIHQQPQLLTAATSGIQAAYAENVFPAMKIGWETYRSLLSHGPDFDKGCFRCHGGEHKAASGEVISADCNTCHTLLAEGEQNPAILKTLRGE